jgi:hypothetical protein
VWRVRLIEGAATRDGRVAGGEIVVFANSLMLAPRELNSAAQGHNSQRDYLDPRRLLDRLVGAYPNSIEQRT